MPTERRWWKDSASGMLRDGEAPSTGAEWVWVDVEAPDEDVLRALVAELHLDPVAVEDALDAALFPRYEDFGHFVAIAVRSVSTAGERIESAPLLCFVAADFIVTLHREPMPGLDFVVDTARNHEPTAEGGPDRMLGRLADAVSRGYEPLLDEIDALLLDCEGRALAGESGAVRMLQPIRRQVNTLRPVIRAQRSVLQSVVYSDSGLISERARRRLTDVLERHARMEDSLELARVTANSIVELHRGTVAETTNEIMKVLTVFSATLLPMTLIAGIYGMNFTNIPELDYRWGYPLTLGIMITLGTVLWRYFVRRGFVGGPRLTDLVSPVTSSLFDAASRPVHALGSLVVGALHPHGDRRSEPPPPTQPTAPPS